MKLKYLILLLLITTAILNAQVDDNPQKKDVLIIFDYDLTLSSHKCENATEYCQTVCNTYNWNYQCQAPGAQQVIQACVDSGVYIGIASHAALSECWDTKVTFIITQQQFPALTNAYRYNNKESDFMYPQIDEYSNWNSDSSAYHLNPDISKSEAITRIMRHYGFNPADTVHQSKVIFFDDSPYNIKNVNTYLPGVNTVEVERFGSGNDGGCGITWDDFIEGWNKLGK